MAKDKEIYWKREWLNNKGHHSTAFIFANLTTWDESNRSLEGEVVIGDCSRQVSLDLTIYEGEYRDPEYANVMQKLNTMIDTLTEVRDAITEHMETP